MRILSRKDVLKAITIKESIEAMRETFLQHNKKNYILPHRIPIQTKEGVSLFMPSLLDNQLGIKVVSVRKENEKFGLPNVLGVVMLLDETTGAVKGLMDAAELTALRTAAGSALSTELLSNKKSSNLVCFGAGLQARAHIEAIIEVRPIKHVKIHNRSMENAVKLSKELSEKYSNIKFEAIENPNDISDAHIIVTTTNSSQPLFKGENLPKGVHLCCIGSYTPTMQEVDEITIKKSKIIVDDLKNALEEAGDIIIPLNNKTITVHHILGELGNVCAGKKIRESEDDITLFKSVGLGLQDIGIGKLILEKAEKMDLGIKVEL